MSDFTEVERDEIVYERIGPTFDELVQTHKPDESRPSLEHYRRHDEIDVLLPV